MKPYTQHRIIRSHYFQVIYFYLQKIKQRKEQLTKIKHYLQDYLLLFIFLFYFFFNSFILAKFALSLLSIPQSSFSSICTSAFLAFFTCFSPLFLAAKSILFSCLFFFFINSFSAFSISTLSFTFSLQVFIFSF